MWEKTFKLCERKILSCVKKNLGCVKKVWVVWEEKLLSFVRKHFKLCGEKDFKLCEKKI